MELTPNAIRKLKEMLEAENLAKAVIRVSVDKHKYAPCPWFSVEPEKKEDEKTASIEGIPLAMSFDTARALSGYVIDYNTNGFRVDFMLPAGRCCR